MSFNIYFLLFPWNFTSHKDGVAAVLSAGAVTTAAREVMENIPMAIRIEVMREPIKQ